MSRDWLNHFPAEHRGAVCNRFYRAARAGHKDPKKLCSAVYQNVSEGLLGRTGNTEVLKPIQAALVDDPKGAIALAEWVLHQERLPPCDRVKAKETEEERGKREWMESQPPTLPQKNLLASLGYTGEIKNRQHASDLINQLKTW